MAHMVNISKCQDHKQVMVPTEFGNDKKNAFLRHPFNGRFSRTAWVSWHQKG